MARRRRGQRTRAAQRSVRIQRSAACAYSAAQRAHTAQRSARARCVTLQRNRRVCSSGGGRTRGPGKMPSGRRRGPAGAHQALPSHARLERGGEARCIMLPWQARVRPFAGEGCGRRSKNEERGRDFAAPPAAAPAAHACVVDASQHRGRAVLEPPCCTHARRRAPAGRCCRRMQPGARCWHGAAAAAHPQHADAHVLPTSSPCSSARPHACAPRGPRRAAAAGKDGAAGLSEEALKEVVAKLAAAEAEAAQLRSELAAKEVRACAASCARQCFLGSAADALRARRLPRWAARRRTSWRG
jgi:hypothetical protein